MRIAMFGFSIAAINGIIAIGIFAIGCSIIHLLSISRVNKHIYMNLLCVITALIVLYFELYKTSYLYEVLFSFFIFSILGAMATYLIVEYVKSCNVHFREIKYYSMMANNLTDLITTHNIDGSFKYVSNVSEVLCGWSQSELMGKFPHTFIHPDDIEVFNNRSNSINAAGDTHTQKYRFRHKNGKYIWLETSSKSVSDKNGNVKEIVSVSRDITSRKRIEEDLRIVNRRFIAIFKNAGVGVVLRDVEGKLITANTKYLEMLGYSEKDVKFTDDIVYEEDRLKENILYKELIEGKRESYRLEKRYIAKNSKVIWTDATVTRIPGAECDKIYALATINDITEIKDSENKLMKLNEKFKTLSRIDGLTQTANRRCFDEYIEQEWIDSARKSRPLSLLLIDVDYFKAFNDTYGHIRGDECLKVIAKTLKDTVKLPNDLITRYGGEEFAIVLPETDRLGAIHIAEKLRKNVEALRIPNINSKAIHYVTISIGVSSIIPSILGKYKKFVEETDKALYVAKEKGRNRIEYYSRI
jgi:diguanylate cyclase (GGDEF)-like protein/PAS domain S-box-containing protein